MAFILAFTDPDTMFPTVPITEIMGVLEVILTEEFVQVTPPVGDTVTPEVDINGYGYSHSG